ncbi:MAG TPA: type II toxin-antitoxin system RelE/ParE family toxin [Chloroflexi bacterium]|nr:type II toxin-antitoxin system RelE/ParE family toxin [Chloroflexota bacterium]
MKVYQIDIARSVRRQIEALPGHMRQRVKREIAKLAFNPRPDHARELRGSLAGRYKIRLDHYRLVYRVDDEAVTVVVLQAGMKHDGFYDELD